MKKRLLLLILTLTVFASLLLVCTLPAVAATAPTKMWVEPTEENGIPARSAIGVNALPGNLPVEIEAIFEFE